MQTPNPNAVWESSNDDDEGDRAEPRAERTVRRSTRVSSGSENCSSRAASPFITSAVTPLARSISGPSRYSWSLSS